ncbi:PQQ-dependent catabolism-associated CXXCW motif protein [Fulvimarina sp. 2208YS6-2-32]|uniref:PQQ-dependent catabolism-associated CXXCW motif protein n=1 Tax=Fulvimarina uroteuthidis TaxID=3098149 RepID=A0ABU5HZE8_9HYPH|nr:PQQ-dependent catabolism-associated CXXCW motif protein [Fulvimarina sp. 2208YS6-2-32]MDY8108237.1 PQQ-dependent catabolism-associated CXXCW motif protein [Fulvimarina sp. 2208YS6-2-32]
MLRRWSVFRRMAPLLLLACLSGAAAAEAMDVDRGDDLPLSVDTVPEPEGYRMDDYRAPVPSTLTGGTVADIATVKALHDEGVPFVDVLPRAPKPEGLPEGTYWRPKPRLNIPGSVWLVDTGYGKLAPVMEDYFLEGLDEAVGKDRSRPIVIYCDDDCWMSYNAARRAIENGFTKVFWYPEGTQGWAKAGYDLVRAEPLDRPDE